MLDARCAFCGYTAPLNCSGQFMPHATLLVSFTNMGPTCPDVRSSPTDLHVPVLPSAIPVRARHQPDAPTGLHLRAGRAGTAGSLTRPRLKSAFSDAVGKFASEFGKGAAEAVFGQFR